MVLEPVWVLPSESCQLTSQWPIQKSRASGEGRFVSAWVKLVIERIEAARVGQGFMAGLSGGCFRVLFWRAR